MNGKPLDYAMVSLTTCTALAMCATRSAQFDAAQCPDGAGCQYAEQAAMALQVVSHESYHRWGAGEETKAECYGRQSIFYVATQLGASLEQGKELGSALLDESLPSHVAQRPKYYSAGCRSGGRLDLRPRDRRWPE